MSLNTSIHSILYPRIMVGNSPSAIAYDPVHQRMYVAAGVDGNNTLPGNIYVIDTNLYSVLGNPIVVGIIPVAIAYDPVHQRMYVTNFGNVEVANSSNISVIDTNTNQVTETINSIHNTDRIAYDPVHQRMYVTNVNSNKISIVDTNTNQVTEGILPEAIDGDIAYDPVHQRMYVTNVNSNKIFVIDTESNTVGSSIVIDKYATEIAYDPVHQRMYVTIFGNPNSNSEDAVAGKKIFVIDTESNTVQNTIDIDYGPWGIAYDSAHRRMYVSLYGSRSEIQSNNPLNLDVLNKVSVINTDNNVIEKEIIVGKGPTDLAYDQIHQRMYVTIFGSEDPDGGKNEINIISI